MSKDLVQQVKSSLDELLESEVEAHTSTDNNIRYNYFDFTISSVNGEKFENFDSAIITIGINERLDMQYRDELFVTVLPLVELGNPDSSILKVAINEINSWIPGKIVIAPQDGRIAQIGDLFANQMYFIHWLKPISTDLIFDLLQIVATEADAAIGELKEKGFNIVEKNQD